MKLSTSTISYDNFQVHYFPVLKDNFQYILHNRESAWIVDPADYSQIKSYLSRNNLKLNGVLITHEHDDHICGMTELLTEHSDLIIYGSPNTQLPFYTDFIKPKQNIEVLGQTVEIIELSGHTKEQVGYYFKQQKVLFSGDAIFHLGCGRVFNGTMEEHFNSLLRIKNLSAGTDIYCSHDYSEANIQFATHYLKFEVSHYIEKNKIPISLDNEKNWNPFLKVTDLSQFIALRTARNNW